eukprot:scaffold2752_cov393-Prasinococcus_capsulatus_cf.AAC.43
MNQSQGGAAARHRSKGPCDAGEGVVEYKGCANYPAPGQSAGQQVHPGRRVRCLPRLGVE